MPKAFIEAMIATLILVSTSDFDICHIGSMKALTHKRYETCADPESFVRGGPNLKTFFMRG